MRAGKVKAIGASNVDVAWLEEAGDRVQWVQNSYSLLDRESEDVLFYCADHGIGFSPFSPLAGGWLTGNTAVASAATRFAHDDAARALPASRR